MKLQIDNDDIRTSIKIFNTHQTIGECRMRFWHSSYQTLSARALFIPKVTRPYTVKESGLRKTIHGHL